VPTQAKSVKQPQRVLVQAQVVMKVLTLFKSFMKRQKLRQNLVLTPQVFQFHLKMVVKKNCLMMCQPLVSPLSYWTKMI
jgi:hypothetical protein